MGVTFSRWINALIVPNLPLAFNDRSSNKKRLPDVGLAGKTDGRLLCREAVRFL